MGALRFFSLAAALSALSLSLGTLHAEPGIGELRVHVITAQGDAGSGKIVCDLYSGPDGFPTRPAKAIAHTEAPIANHTGLCVFHNVRKGTYAVGAFHDENGNGRMDTNFIGMPAEPVGVSNDARGTFGPPSYEASSFFVSGAAQDISIHLM